MEKINQYLPIHSMYLCTYIISDDIYGLDKIQKQRLFYQILSITVNSNSRLYTVWLYSVIL